MSTFRRSIVRAAQLLGLVVAVGVTGLVLPQPAPGQASTTTTSVEIAFARSELIPCALGGAGEFVALSGPLHILITQTTDANGGTHLEFHANPEGIIGWGLVSGDKYQGTGVTRQHINTSLLPPFDMTFVDNFRLIGQKTGNNLLLHTTIHLTVSANGDVTADITKSSIDCK